MRKIIIEPEKLIGKRFGRLLVDKIDHVDVYTDKRGGKHNVVIYLCKCDCGSEVKVKKQNLLNGSTNSCGCLRKELKTHHGMRHTRFYHIYIGMKSRCNNANDTTYHLYGARGIKVCDRWMGEDGFIHFMEDMYEDYLKQAAIYGEENISIDRIDVNDNYDPSNCRWVTNEVQANNKRNNFYVIYNDEKISLSYCVKKYADCRLTYDTIYRRIVFKGWDIDRALHELPTIYKGQLVTCPISFRQPINSTDDNLIYPFRNK